VAPDLEITLCIKEPAFLSS